MQTLTIAGDFCFQPSPRIAQRAFEPARAFRLKRRITNETPGKEAVEIEEGRLGNSLRIRRGEREASTHSCQKSCSNRRRILEPVEDVAPDRKIAREPARVGAPFERHRFVIAGSILVAVAKRIAGLECLMFG